MDRHIDSLIINTLQPEVHKKVCITKKYIKKTKNLRIYITNTEFNNKNIPKTVSLAFRYEHNVTVHNNLH